MENPSFAGAFAYETNIPMKTFMGNRPAPPVEHVIEALAAGQAGKASGPQQETIKAALQPAASACMVSYKAAASQCSAGDRACQQRALQAMQSCLQVGR